METHLFKTTEELKDFLPNTAGDILEQVLQFVGIAEQQQIVKFIGQTTFDELNEDYNDEQVTLTADQANLLEQLRKPLAFFAMEYYIPHGQVLISPSGIRINNTDTMKTAFEWQIQQIKWAYHTQAFDMVDRLIKWLYDRLDIYTDYASSSAFTNNHAHLLTYASDMDKYHWINTCRATFEMIRPAIRDIETMHVREAIGGDYYDELIEKLRDDDLNSDDTAILGWLQAGVAKLSIGEAAKRNLIKLTPKGVMSVKESASGNVAPTVMDQQYRTTFIQTCETWGNSYMSKVREYLNAHASETVYPTFFASDKYADPEVTVTPTYSNSMEGAKVFHV